MAKVVKIIGINGRFTHSALAIFYLRQMITKRWPQFVTELLQFSINDNYFETLLRIVKDKPQAVLFSAAIWNSSLIEKLIVDIAELLPKSILVVGGPQAAVVGDTVPKGLCTVVCGELEALPEAFFDSLSSAIEEGRRSRLPPRYDVSFFSFLKMEKMAQRREDPAFAFPYCDEDFNSHLANRHIYYESSRGCPFRCSYCLSSVHNGLYHKELAVVCEELRQILRHRPKVVRFIDRTFNDIPERSLVIWQFLRDEGGETLFHFEMAPDRFTEEMFLFLESLPAGRFQFEIGIQSTNPEALAAVNRTVDMDKVAGNIKRLAALDTIHLHLDLILGLPYDTPETFADSFRTLFAFGVHYIQMGLLKVLPGTEIAKKSSAFGYLWTKEPPYSLLASRWIKHETMQELYWFSELVEKFMNTRYFRSLWQYLRRQNEDIYRFFYNLQRDCGEDFFFAPASQERLCKELFENTRNREDATLIAELLAFDWIRCNHRFLPDFLQDFLLEEPNALRTVCQKALPDELPGLYSRRQRSHFFRSSFFMRPSQSLLAEIGSSKASYSDVIMALCFIKKEEGLNGYNTVLRIGNDGVVDTINTV